MPAAMSMTRTQGSSTDHRWTALHPDVCRAEGPWSGPGVPSTAADEQVFVDELRRMAGRKTATYERPDLTVLMTALRSGLPATDLLGQAPGIDPRRLLAAYRDLEARRSLAETAWYAIANEPSPRMFDLLRNSAASLLPVLIGGLASDRADEDLFTMRLSNAVDAVATTTVRVLALEARLGDALDPSRRRELGAALYNIRGGSAWDTPSYLPVRVGSLMPARVDRLIGDAVDGPKPRPRPIRFR